MSETDAVYKNCPPEYSWRWTSHGYTNI